MKKTFRVVVPSDRMDAIYHIEATSEKDAVQVWAQLSMKELDDVYQGVETEASDRKVTAQVLS